ncbi:3-oxoacyl-[acyl-carrier protein] reductase [Minicystis rosea]|nr:3-oxoacyl-[acyl-carrier protein] reductase [Minicystis rosea]
MKLISNSAIVTGGGQGIGLGIAARLLRDGANVVLFGRTASKLEAAAEALNRAAAGPARALPFAGDASRAEDVTRCLEAATAAFGLPGILVNNAGTATLAPIVDMPEEDFDQILAINLKGPFLFMKAVARKLIAEKKPGAFVNISSLNQVAPTDGLAHYCASKAGLGQLTKVAAGELGRHGIRVNVVAPGLIHTPLADGAGLTKGLSAEKFVERTPLGRIGEVEDVAPVVSFLCSEDARWVTGETILVDGGNHIRGLHSYWDTMTAG